MGQYNKAVLTAAGENLIARTLAGEIQLNITKAKTSNYIYPASTDFKSLTDMQGIKQTATDPVTAVYNDTMIQTRVLFSNEEIASTYYIHNIGLYAMNGTQEVLFCIVTAESPDEMPQYNGVASTSYIYNIQNVVQDAAQLNITVNPSGTATIQDVLERVDATGGNISETVIETLDTVEDKYPIPAAGESVKRFFGKVLTFLRNIRPLTSDITLYVSTIGSDILGDGTQSNPFKTIQHAIDILPKDLGGYSAYIIVSNGTYDEDLWISGFNSGLVNILSNSPESTNTDVAIKSVTSIFSDAYIKLSGLYIYGSNSNGASVTISACKMASILYTLMDSSSPMGIFGQVCETLRINTCTISNKTNTAISYSDASGYVLGVSGTNNSVGITSGGCSVVHLINIYITATTLLYQSTGGMFINQNGTQISDLISSGLTCTWGTISGGYFRHGNINGFAMVTIQILITVTSALSSGTQYVINGFPIASVNADFGVASSLPSQMPSCYFSASLGRVAFTLTGGVGVGSKLAFSCTYKAS